MGSIVSKFTDALGLTDVQGQKDAAERAKREAERIRAEAAKEQAEREKEIAKAKEKAERVARRKGAGYAGTVLTQGLATLDSEEAKKTELGVG